MCSGLLGNEVRFRGFADETCLDVEMWSSLRTRSDVTLQIHIEEAVAVEGTNRSYSLPKPAIRVEYSN